MIHEKKKSRVATNQIKILSLHWMRKAQTCYGFRGEVISVIFWLIRYWYDDYITEIQITKWIETVVLENLMKLRNGVRKTLDDYLLVMWTSIFKLNTSDIISVYLNKNIEIRAMVSPKSSGNAYWGPKCQHEVRDANVF